jgi:uncharacterized membrane protein (DUF106 family)
MELTMFDCSIDKYVFWFGFIIGGIICTAIFELIQMVILSISGVKKLSKEMESKSNERIEPKL